VWWFNCLATQCTWRILCAREGEAAGNVTLSKYRTNRKRARLTLWNIHQVSPARSPFHAKPTNLTPILHLRHRMQKLFVYEILHRFTALLRWISGYVVFMRWRERTNIGGRSIPGVCAKPPPRGSNLSLVFVARLGRC
jgi:hypothetical protein